MSKRTALGRRELGLAALVAVALGGVLWSRPAAAVPPARNFIAHLSGAGEVPPRDTPAHGVAKFEVNADGTLDFKLNVVRIENVVAAHIHIGDPTVNGPVVAFLYGDVPPGGGAIQGRIADGTIQAGDLVGPLAGQPLLELIGRMRAGNTYVNVHTNDGVAPINTGPGDFPGGEIRGQIQPLGP